MDNRQWLVLWARGGRVGSVELTEENKQRINQEFCTSLIQRDASGTEHWNIIAPLKRRKS
jgi:hypothetical protein